MDAEAWNDDVMVGLLHDAIRTHRTKHDARGRLEWTTPATLLHHRQNASKAPIAPEMSVPPSNSDSPAEWTAAEATRTETTGATTTDDYLQSQTRAALAVDPSMDEPLTTLLMAWYNCGYATGRYQTLIELQGLHFAASTQMHPGAAETSMTAAGDNHD